MVLVTKTITYCFILSCAFFFCFPVALTAQNMGENQQEILNKNALLQSLEAETGQENFEAMARLCLELATLEEKNGRPDKSISLLQNGLGYAKKDPYDSIQARILKKLAECHEQEGNYQASLLYYQQFIHIRDSLLEHENIRQFMQQELKHKSDQYEASCMYKALKKKLAITIYGVFFLLGLLIFLIIFQKKGLLKRS
jgi:tetratricopeptide (TPR) repeat protein